MSTTKVSKDQPRAPLVYFRMKEDVDLLYT